MSYATDLKSVVRKGVRVGVPPPAPMPQCGSGWMRPGASDPLKPSGRFAAAYSTQSLVK